MNFSPAPWHTQSYNRYAYVFNNPLRFIDPTGYTTNNSNTIEIIDPIQIRQFWNLLMANWENNRDEQGSSGGGSWGGGGPSIGGIWDYIVSNGFGERPLPEITVAGTGIPGSYRPIGGVPHWWGDHPARYPGWNVANGGGWLSNWWNTHWTAKLIPDVIYINSSLGWDMLGRNNGGSYTTGYAIPIRGKQSGRLFSYQTFSSGFSMHGGYGVNIGYSVYTGNDARNFDFEQLFGGESIGIVDDLVIGFGFSSNGLDNQGGKLNSLDLGFGWFAGAGSNVHGSTTLNKIW